MARSRQSKFERSGPGLKAGLDVRPSEGAPTGAPSLVSGRPAEAPVRTSRPRRHRVARGVGRRVLVLVAIALWIGAVVYPDPRPFFTSVARLRQPPIDAAAVGELAAALPDDYERIEQFTLSYVPFAPAWDVYGLPWYFPSVAEVVRDKAGDCQARAILLGSILEAKGMPYTMHYSFDHVWIDYPGKPVSALDDPSTSFASDAGEGWFGSLPDRIPIGTIIQQRVAYHWTPMPLFQKILIVLGAALIVGWGEHRLLTRAGRGLLGLARRSGTSGAGSAEAG